MAQTKQFPVTTAVNNIYLSAIFLSTANLTAGTHHANKIAITIQVEHAFSSVLLYISMELRQKDI